MATGKYHRDLAEKKRGHIIGAARRLFIERGFEDMTMTDVAEAANVSAMTLYKHFPSKDDLLGVILDEMSEQLHLVLSAPIDRNAPPRQALEDYVRRFCALISDDDVIESIRRVIAIAPKFPTQAKRFREQTTSMLHDRLANYFDELIAKGVIRSHRSTDSVGQLLGYLLNSLMFAQLLDRHKHENPALAEEISEFAINTFFKAYGT